MSGGKGFIIENHSPYYLHPSEGPGVTITSVIFNGKNYELWQKVVRTALKSKNKLVFIEGTITKPTPKGEDLSEFNAWEMVNSMICSWIINVIDPKLHASVAYAETAYEMWQNLRKRYAVANTPKIHQLKTDLAACKQGGLEVMDFYSKLMGMWSELENYAKVPQCTCGKCECKIGSRITKMAQDEKTHQFFMGLNDEVFSTIRSQILALDPLPTLDVIFNMVTQEENHRRVMLGRDNRSANMVAFVAREHTNERPSCKHCGWLGHDEASCYEIIGYPPNWVSRGRG